ncbi:MAG: response regulator transcription factor [Eubacteriaceae bacterium]|nr:response regulator transcription factor [Eubacteriaceae bacterium]
MSQDKIMIIDNEMEIVQLIKMYLSREGYEVVWTTDSTKACEIAKKENPDLLLLDVVMPGQNGIDVCSKIREFSNAPIVFVTCKDEEMDKVLGLSIGSDDYITKPFSPAELIARVKAHLRRKNISNAGSEDGNRKDLIAVRDLKIDRKSHTVTFRGDDIHLTATEFDLLSILAEEPNRVFTARQLFNSLWKSDGEEDDVRTIMVHISNIRKKLDTSSDEYIKTVRGVGYKLS